MNSTFLCIDLDGTLIRNDTLQLALWQFVGKSPTRLLKVLGWLLRGRAYLKRQIAERITLDASQLPYNAAFLTWLKIEKQLGHKLILVSATDQKYADAVGIYLGIFDEVIASNGKINLRSHNKAAELNRRYGKNNYIYAGNSSADLPVWRNAKAAVVVNASSHLLSRAEKVASVIKIFG